MDPDKSAEQRDERQPHSPVEHRCGHTPPTTSASRPADDPAANHPDLGKSAPTLAEVKDWPATVDVPTAGSAFGLSRSHSYELIKRGQFPARAIQVGSRYRVITESIIRALSDDPESHKAPPEPPR